MIYSMATWIAIDTPALYAMKSLLSKPPAPDRGRVEAVNHPQRLATTAEISTAKLLRPFSRRFRGEGEPVHLREVAQVE